MRSLEPTSEPRRKRRARRRGRSKEDPDQILANLRRVVVGPERSRIELLEGRAQVAPEAVGAFLPEAVSNATQDREQDLATALEPTMTRALGVVVRRRPEVFSDILAPTIGMAVRKAVAAAFAAMLESFNETLERSLSLRSMQWRIEAARTGRPFAEVVLIHTMQYRIEQVFLIHTETSLVLQHVVETGNPADSSDQIAAMLTAIDSFGREAFRAPPEAHLDKFQIGELTVWVSRDPSLSIAAVVRGTPPSAISTHLDEARERIRVLSQPHLGAFSGDVKPFSETRSELEALLGMQRKPPARRAHIWMGAAMVVLLLAAIGFGMRSAARRNADARTREAYVDALVSEPGVLVTSSEWQNGRGRFVGFRDPLAPEPDAILAGRGLSPTTTVFAPFISLDPRITLRRAERVLEPPPGVTLTLDEGTLRARGVAPHAWIEMARLLGRSLPGAAHFDGTALAPKESLDQLGRSAIALEGAFIPFDLGQARIRERDRAALGRIAALGADAVRLANEAHVGVCLLLLGHTDRRAPRNAEMDQDRLSSERAERIASELVTLGLGPENLRAKGAGTWDESGERGRSVTFRLQVADDARRGCEGVP